MCYKYYYLHWTVFIFFGRYCDKDMCAKISIAIRLAFTSFVLVRVYKILIVFKRGSVHILEKFNFIKR